MKLQIVAVADGYPTHSYLKRGWDALLNSCRRHQFEPVILGWSKPWTGLGSKPKLLKKAIEDGTVSADYILWIDAFDVVFADSPEKILDTYLAEFADKYRIVWNAEKNCFPDADWAQHHPKTDSPFKYLNSGMSIGDTKAYHTIFTQMGVDSWPDDHQRPDGGWHHVNDQQFVMAKFLFGQCAEDEPKMTLDTQCKMFQVLVGVEPEELEITSSGIRNKITNTSPIAFHFAGGSKTAGLMEPILQSMNL